MKKAAVSFREGSDGRSDITALKVVPDAGYAFTGWTVNGEAAKRVAGPLVLASRSDPLPPGTTEVNVEVECLGLTVQKLSNDPLLARTGGDTDEFRVRVADANNVGQAGILMQFAVTNTPAGCSGEHLVYDRIETNANGEAPNKLFLGASVACAGTYTVTVTASYQGRQIGTPVTFTIQGHAVTVAENPTQAYGYDDYTHTLVPYKSVEVAQSDPVHVTIIPGGAALMFTSTSPAQVTVNPPQPTGYDTTLTLTGIANGPATIQMTNSAGSDIDLIHAQTYTKPSPKPRVALIPVIEENDDVQEMPVGQQGTPYQLCVSSGANGGRDTNPQGDDQINGENINTGANGICDTPTNATDIPGVPIYVDQIRTHLNRAVYNQAVFEWDVELRPAKRINFDLDRDGALDDTYWKTPEQLVIITQGSDPQYTYNVFFVCKSKSGHVGGFTFPNQGYIFVTADGFNIEHTVAHELGHARFSLEQLYADPENLMFYTGNGWRLRKWQWDKINP